MDRKSVEKQMSEEYVHETEEKPRCASCGKKGEIRGKKERQNKYIYSFCKLTTIGNITSQTGRK